MKVIVSSHSFVYQLQKIGRFNTFKQIADSLDKSLIISKLHGFIDEVNLIQ